MDIVSLATSGPGGKVLTRICGKLPVALSYRICRWAAARLAQKEESPFVGALRSNMAVVHGMETDDPRLSGVVTQLLENTLCSYVDLFRAAASAADPHTRCQMDPETEQLIQECRSSGQGLLLVGAHMCSFDFLLIKLREHFPQVQLLSMADPVGGNCVMNQLRRAHGLNVTPISRQTLRQAMETLRNGGVVAIAADLPAVEGGAELEFFGRNAALLVGHSRLAVSTGARMVVGASHRKGRDAYWAEATLVPRPVKSGDRRRDVLHWAQASLAAMEKFIGRWPDEWLMPKPIWTEAPALEA